MTNFVVDFFQNANGVSNRHRLQGSKIIHLNNAQSDFAVQAYLKRMYPDSEIIINNVEWK
jgi:hypothetical protein